MKRVLEFCIFIGLGAASISHAQAEFSKNNFAKCAAIQGELARLECFDKLAKSSGLDKPQPSRTSVNDSGEWIVSKEINPVDDSTTIRLVLQAKSGESKYGNKMRLVVRCQSNKTEMYINWHDYLGSDVDVLTRIGSNKAMKYGWSLSTDKNSSFYPGSPIKFLLTMMESDSFLAQTTPYNENPVTAIFKTAGMRNAIVPLREQCGWSEEDLKKRAQEKKRAEEQRKHEIIQQQQRKAQSAGKYKDFILGHAGEIVRIRSSSWNSLSRADQKILDDALRIYIVNDNDPNASNLPR